MFSSDQIDAIARVRAEIRQAEEALIQALLRGRVSAETMAQTSERLSRASAACLEYPYQG